MTEFKRKINLAHADNIGKGTYPWLDDLLRLWAPAGTAIPEGAVRPLRFAIRNNYANFYADGQSIAEVRLGRDECYAKVHEKYLQQDKQKRDELGQEYVVIRSAENYRSQGASVADWMKIAADYSGPEQRFVEKIVASNPDVIDLEMELPALDGAERKSAVRMDVVVLEPVGDGWRLVFWEAKMADNPEARAEGDTDPRVIEQCKKYKAWLDASSGNEQAVLTAYRLVCEDLVAIHKRAEDSGLGEGLTAKPGIRHMMAFLVYCHCQMVRSTTSRETMTPVNSAPGGVLLIIRTFRPPNDQRARLAFRRLLATCWVHLILRLCFDTGGPKSSNVLTSSRRWFGISGNFHSISMRQKNSSKFVRLNKNWINYPKPDLSRAQDRTCMVA